MVGEMSTTGKGTIGGDRVFSTERGHVTEDNYAKCDRRGQREKNEPTEPS